VFKIRCRDYKLFKKNARPQGNIEIVMKYVDNVGIWQVKMVWPERGLS
jgi:hypothetical protein